MLDTNKARERKMQISQNEKDKKQKNKKQGTEGMRPVLSVKIKKG
jgi:hypothetical protein